MIKLVLCDVDGTLTDGGYYISEDELNPFVVKKFKTRDFLGLQSLACRGILVVFITGATDECIDRKVETLLWNDMVRVHSGVTDKLKLVTAAYLDEYSFDEMAFIGDDINDLDLLQKTGIAACPSDADEQILEYIKSREDGYVMSRKAGDNAVREFCNMLLKLVDNSNIINIEGDNNG